LAVALAVSASPPARADAWYEHYARAEAALAAENWSGAIDELNQALEKRGDSSERARTYGMKVVAYFPYLKLGVAYFHAGQLDAALNAFDTEERIGAVTRSAEAKSELETVRALAREAQLQAIDDDRRRVRAIVEESLTTAERLEAEGRLREAAARVGNALALDPDNGEAEASLQRLRAGIARRDDEIGRKARHDELVDRGRRLLDDGAFGAAASALSQAIDLLPDPVAADLLSRARQGLRRAQQKITPAERDRQIDTGLAEARSLAAGGDLDRALDRLEAVRALAPDDPAVASMQSRLIQERRTTERDTARRKKVEDLLGVARGALAAGEIENALSTANEILALDPQNGDALETLAASYRRLNRSLLGRAPLQNIPPAIRFADRRTDLDRVQAERIDRPEFRLQGVVIDESGVEIVVHDDEGRALEPTVRQQAVGGVMISEFSLDTSLQPGLSAFHLTVTDSGNQSTGSDYAVLYSRPLYRAPWFWAATTASATLAAGAALARRAGRRRRLRTRRFNPFVAGAPVLDERLFFGRQDVVERILQTVHNNSLLLYGERRIGKTSIQHHLRRRLSALADPDYQFFPVYIDLQGVPEEDFFRSLADDIFAELSPHLEGLTRSRAEDGEYSFRLFVRDLQAVIRTLKRKSPRRVKLVLLIDEVDELNDYDPRINQRLRSLFMKGLAEHLVAVVSGVEIRKRWERETSPWYNFFEALEIRPFGPDDARALIEQPMQGIFRVDPAAIERILEITSCRPYRIQKLCMAVVQRMHEEDRRRITVDDVEAVGPSGAESS